MTPAAQREAVRALMTTFKLSERRACGLRSAMIPEPTTAAKSRAVPTISAVTRRPSPGVPRRSWNPRLTRLRVTSLTRPSTRHGRPLPEAVRGEPLDAVSRESQVPAHELESWKRAFLEAGARWLKSRSDPEERELTLARAKIGELMMRLELAEPLIERRGFADEWKRSQR